ncbi:hypothetical protein KSU1_C1098 [Candidatus Jettenia caeni]|uniref:Uncharacterized protein n=1 Tax=Candidatus Jettenia caeni TaxID=247490 RepID=I3ILU9_9BACT|nr:hypothetical protein KSU1_C1098 [Candidatus Jettenia caeni]
MCLHYYFSTPRLGIIMIPNLLRGWGRITRSSLLIITPRLGVIMAPNIHLGWGIIMIPHLWIFILR